jgi:hypothetical protein
MRSPMLCMSTTHQREQNKNAEVLHMRTANAANDRKVTGRADRRGRGFQYAVAGSERSGAPLG